MSVVRVGRSTTRAVTSRHNQHTCSSQDFDKQRTSLTVTFHHFTAKFSLTHNKRLYMPARPPNQEKLANSIYIEHSTHLQAKPPLNPAEIPFSYSIHKELSNWCNRNPLEIQHPATHRPPSRARPSEPHRHFTALSPEPDNLLPTTDQE